MDGQGYMLSPDAKLKFEVSTQISLLSNAQFVDLAYSPDGSLLVIAYQTCAHLLAHIPDKDAEYQEHWSTKVVYHISPDINGNITCMSWNGDGILVFGFDCGDVAMVLVNSKETILRGFDVSEYAIGSIELDQGSQLMAVVAGGREISFWEFMPVPGPWKPLNLLPTLPSDLALRIHGAHWIDGSEKPTIAVAYEQQGIVVWVMDFPLDDANPSDTVQVPFPITTGFFSPNGHLFLQPDDLGGFQVYDIRQGRGVKEFRHPDSLQHTGHAKFLVGGEWLVGTGVGMLNFWGVRSRKLAHKISINPEYAALYDIDRIAESGIRRGNTLENFRIATHFARRNPTESQGQGGEVVVFKVFPRDDLPTAPIIVVPINPETPPQETESRVLPYTSALGVTVMGLLACWRVIP
ncbi:hypothetical protein DFP72DRAFT_1074297 [Ephemerocybe angulata]|uniref:Uncharacterized protein n=1 Tax=Ephemerocybe angulata TaxID=980116 RepID=A0A8H6HMA9_9AGAR|nr:hypothetical protein DFP72DRAFT_1074297 [Tulosesus angulatus]